MDARDQLPAGHVVFGLIENMRRVDMSAFEAAYRLDGVGRPPYDPRVIVTLLLYCRMKGITSTRWVAMACRDDHGAMLITGGRHPDRSTLDRLWRRTRRRSKRCWRRLCGWATRWGLST